MIVAVAARQEDNVLVGPSQFPDVSADRARNSPPHGVQSHLCLQLSVQGEPDQQSLVCRKITERIPTPQSALGTRESSRCLQPALSTRLSIHLAGAGSEYCQALSPDSS